MHTLSIKKLTETAKIPTRGSDGAAGFDLYADSFEMNGETPDIPDFNVGSVVKVHTGISMSIPKGYVGLIYPRSGLACKKGIRLSNSTGVIDEDYRGEIIVCLHRDTMGDPAIDGQHDVIHKGDRVAQIVFQKYEAFPIQVVQDLDDTERGAGGFGSTGISTPNENDTIEKVKKLIAEIYDFKNVSLEDAACRLIADCEEDLKSSGAEDDGTHLYDNDANINYDVLKTWIENCDISYIDKENE
jgi:dUTP pyrophosphatase